MSKTIDFLESTQSSYSKYDLYCKFIEEMELPLSKTDQKRLKVILTQIESENPTEIPSNLIEKLIKISKICLSHENSSKKCFLQSQKIALKTFYTYLQKLAQMKYILFGCSECEKVFKTKEYLRSHIKRRHSDQLIQSLQSSISSN